MKSRTIILIVLLLNSGILFSFILNTEISKQSIHSCSNAYLTDISFTGCLDFQNETIVLKFRVEKNSNIALFDGLIINIEKITDNGKNMTGNSFFLPESSLLSTPDILNESLILNLTNNHRNHQINVNILLQAHYIDDHTEEKTLVLSYDHQNFQYYFKLLLILDLLIGTLLLLLVLIIYFLNKWYPFFEQFSSGYLYGFTINDTYFLEIPAYTFSGVFSHSTILIRTTLQTSSIFLYELNIFLMVVVRYKIKSSIEKLIEKIRSYSIKDEIRNFIRNGITSMLTYNNTEKSFQYYPGKYTKLTTTKATLEKFVLDSENQLDKLTEKCSLIENEILSRNMDRDKLLLFLNIKERINNFLVILNNIKPLSEFISNKTLRKQIKTVLRNFREQNEDYFFHYSNFQFLEEIITQMIEAKYLLKKDNKIIFSKNFKINNKVTDFIQYFDSSNSNNSNKDNILELLINDINSLRNINNKTYSVENLLEEMKNGRRNIRKMKNKLKRFENDIKKSNHELEKLQPQIDSIIREIKTSNKTKLTYIKKSEKKVLQYEKEPNKNRLVISEIKSDISFFLNYNR